MENLNNIYKQSFFGKRFRLSWRAPILCGAILKELPSKSVIDVGCAVGDLVKGFMELGVDAYGLEGASGCLPFLECPRDRVFIHDLRLLAYPNVVTRRFDLVTCFEVAEHIEPEWAIMFVRNVTDMSSRILASFAPPGQGGHYHVNCQPMSYWEKLFGVFGFVRDASVEECVKTRIRRWDAKPGIKAIYQNLGYFEEQL